MAGIHIVDEVKQIDGDGNIAKIDDISGSAYIIPLEHGIIHEGKGFFLSVDTQIDPGEFYDVLFITPDDKDVHLMYHEAISTSTPGEFCLHEAPTTSSLGDPLSLVNNNRQSVITPEVLVYENPVVTVPGSEIDCDTLTGTKTTGGSSTDYSSEWILKRSTKYLFRYMNASGIRTDVNISSFHMEL